MSVLYKSDKNVQNCKQDSCKSTLLCFEFGCEKLEFIMGAVLLINSLLQNSKLLISTMLKTSDRASHHFFLKNALLGMLQDSNIEV